MDDALVLFLRAGTFLFFVMTIFLIIFGIKILVDW